MRFFIALSLLQLFALAYGAVDVNVRAGRSILDSAKVALSTAVDVASDTLQKVPVVKDVLPNCVEPEPLCPNENVTFWYYTRRTQDKPVKIDINDPSSFAALERNEDPWKIIIHGYTKSKDEVPNPQLRKEYFKRGEYNLISVDYEPIARDKCYLQAVHNVPLIANCTAQMIDALIDMDYFKSENLHVIGFSLGGQVAGQISEYMKSSKPARVTGLDPASPLFDGKVNKKLTKDAAEFVDVIHTNAVIKGKLETSGHVDFYMNGAVVQPGCLFDSEESSSTCSHNRAPMYFAESINSPDGFWGIPCTTAKILTGFCSAEEKELVLMGEYVSRGANGTYYLKTNSQPPFALGKTTSY